MTPRLETPRLTLEPFGEAHLTERYVGWLNDPEVVRLSDQRFRRHSLDTCREYMRSFADSPNHFWAVVAREPNQGHIGNVNAYVDVHHLLADVGIIIGERSAWGRGLGGEAFRAVVEWLLGPAGLRKVTAGTLAENRAMLGVMRAAGMVEDGRRRAHCLLEGREADVIHMARFKQQPSATPKE